MTGKIGPCKTPGSVYEMDVEPKLLGVKVHLPLPLLDDVTEGEKAEIARRLHDAVLPIAEWVFSRSWETHLAGRAIPNHDGPMPPKHDDL